MARIKFVLQERRKAIVAAREKFREADYDEGSQDGEPAFAEAAEEEEIKETSTAASGPAFMDGQMPPSQPGSQPAAP